MSSNGRRLRTGALLALGVAVVAACRGASTTPPPASPAPSATNDETRATTGTTPSSADDASSGAAPADETPPCPPLAIELPELIEHEGLGKLETPAIERPEVLARFFERTARLLRGRADDHVRLGVYGDSNLTRDFLTGEIRRVLQQRYGDGGHGFIAIGRPWKWYLHEDARHHANEGEWKRYAPSTHRVRDRIYGLAGISTDSRGVGASAYFATADEGSAIGTEASRFGVFYLERPDGGGFEIRADDKVVREVSTAAEDQRVGVTRFELPEGPHRIDLKVTTRDPVRFLGSYLETKDPGIVVDSYGIGGVSYLDLSTVEPTTIQEMMRLRPNDLLVFWIGTNVHGANENPESIHRILEVRRAVDPKLPMMIVTPPDHVRRRTDATSDPQTQKLAVQLREIAKAENVAFWDLREAMGGEGSMSRFVAWGLAAPDLYHLSKKGAYMMGRHLLRALWTSLKEHAEAHPRVGCAAP